MTFPRRDSRGCVTWGRVSLGCVAWSRISWGRVSWAPVRAGVPRWLAAAVVAAGLAAAAPGRACELDELSHHLTAVCEAALAPAAAALAEVLPQATPAERDLAARHLAAAREACATGDPEIGARTAAQLARLAGRIEARLGLDLPLTLASR